MKSEKRSRVKTPRTSACVAFLLLPVTSLVAADRQQTPAVPMRIEIELDNPESVVLENFTFTLRIVNPNPFEVRLPGFEFGYIEPQIHGAGPGLPDGEFVHIFDGVHDSAWRTEPVRIAANKSIEHRRFLFSSFWFERWPIEPGIHYLRPELHIGQTYSDKGEERIPIEWSCETVQLRVRPASTADRRGFAFLTERLREYEQSSGRAGRKPVQVFRAELFGEFLERYGETAYAPEIRWELTTTLRWVFGDPRKRDELSSVGEFRRLFVDCVEYCLDRGSPFSDDLLEWDPKRIKFGFMRFAAKHGMPELLKPLAIELDRRMPEDEAGILYRRLLVAGHRDSYAAAQRVYETLKARFPDSQYARFADGQMKRFARQEEERGAEE